MSMVAVTGCSGHIGTRLLQLLDESPRIDGVIGIDLRPPRGDFGKLQFCEMDVRDIRLKELLRFHLVEQVVHMAYLIESDIHDFDYIYDVDIGGTRNVLEATAYCGADHLVVTSSTTAFGAFPDNPDFLKETDPIRKASNYPYAEYKYEVELMTEDFMAGNPEVKVAIIRPTVVLGPHVANKYVRLMLLRKGIYPAISGSAPDMQFVHEDDVAEVFRRVITTRAQGRFHAVGDGVATVDEICALTGKRIVKIPAAIAYAVMKLMWILRVPSIGPTGMLDYLRYRWVTSDDLTRESLHFQPRYSSLDALRITHEEAQKRKAAKSL